MWVSQQDQGHGPHSLLGFTEDILRESHPWTPKEALGGVAFFILTNIILVPAVTEGPSVKPVLSSIYLFIFIYFVIDSAQLTGGTLKGSI